MALRFRRRNLGLVALRLFVGVVLGVTRRLKIASDFRLAVLEDALDARKSEL